MIKYLFQDWEANKGNVKARFVLFNFRAASLLSSNILSKCVFMPYLLFYRLFFHWIMGIELREGTKIGRGLILHHGQGLVVHHNTKIGMNCTLRQGITIGNKQLIDGTDSYCPIIEDNVNIGANVVIIGPVRIGSNVKIGAGTVVTRDVKSNSRIVGCSFRYL